MATKALDTFTDVNGTLITAHTPDKGFGGWGVVGGVFDGIFSNVLRAAQSAFAVWNLNCSSDVMFDVFEFYCDITRPNDGVSSAHSGLNFRSNGISKSVSTQALSFIWERNTGDPDLVDLKIREWLGIGISNQSVQVGFAWARATAKRMGVIVVGDKVTPYIEDAGGGNRQTFADITPINDYADASHQRFGLWVQGSALDYQYFDNLTVLDYTAPGGTPIPTMYFGRRDTTADVWQFGIGTTDGAGLEGTPAGDAINMLARSLKFAPGGGGGEAIFTRFWVVLTYDMDAVTLRFTPAIDGVLMDGTGTVPDLHQDLTLSGTLGTRVTERFEFILWYPYDSDAVRVALRGTWFQLQIETVGGIGNGTLLIDQPEIEYEIVQESEAAQ